MVRVLRRCLSLALTLLASCGGRTADEVDSRGIGTDDPATTETTDRCEDESDVLGTASWLCTATRADHPAKGTLSRTAGQTNVEARALPHLGVYLHVPAGGVHDGVERRQAQTAAAVSAARGKKRLEDVIEHI